MKKLNLLTPAGLMLIFAGAMLGDNEQIWPCLSLIAAGIGVLALDAYKQTKKESKQ